MARNIITKSNPASETTYAYGGHELLSPAKYAQQIYDSFKSEVAKSNPNMDMKEFLAIMNERMRNGQMERDYLAAGGSYNSQYRKDIMKELQMILTREKIRLENTYNSKRFGPKNDTSPMSRMRHSAFDGALYHSFDGALYKVKTK